MQSIVVVMVAMAAVVLVAVVLVGTAFLQVDTIRSPALWLCRDRSQLIAAVTTVVAIAVDTEVADTEAVVDLAAAEVTVRSEDTSLAIRFRQTNLDFKPAVRLGCWFFGFQLTTAEHINEWLYVEKVHDSVFVEVSFSLETAGDQQIHESLNVQQIDYAVHVDVAK